MSLLFGYVEKQLDQKDWANFKIFDAITWDTNNYNIHIAACHLKT